MSTRTCKLLNGCGKFDCLYWGACSALWTVKPDCANPNVSTEWELADDSGLFGELTDKRTEVERIIADYLRRTALLSEQLATALAGQSVLWSVRVSRWYGCILPPIAQVPCCTGILVCLLLYLSQTLPTRLIILQLIDCRLCMPAIIFYLVTRWCRRGYLRQSKASEGCWIPMSGSIYTR